MDFARQQLEKYGWKDGEGLGKTRNGISNPIKASLKFDNAGLGHKISDELVNPWWQRVYDSAASNVKVIKEDDSVEIKTSGETVITTKKRNKYTKAGESAGYGNFVKRAALTKRGEAVYGSDAEDFEEETDLKKRTSGICELTDEELFKACGGRTAHKGARHGLSMSAKLERSARLEKEKLALLKNKEKRTEEGTEIIQEEEVEGSRYRAERRKKSKGAKSALQSLEAPIETLKVLKENEHEQLDEGSIKKRKKKSKLAAEQVLELRREATLDGRGDRKKRKKCKLEETQDFEGSFETENAEINGTGGLSIRKKKRKEKKALKEEILEKFADAENSESVRLKKKSKKE